MKLKLGFAPPIHHVVSIQKFIAWYDSVLNAVWDGFKMADKQQARIAGFHPSRSVYMASNVKEKVQKLTLYNKKPFKGRGNFLHCF